MVLALISKKYVFCSESFASQKLSCLDWQKIPHLTLSQKCYHVKKCVLNILDNFFCLHVNCEYDI